MIQIVRVINTNEKEDLRALDLHARLKNSKIKKVRSAKVYRLEGIGKNSAELLAENLFSESINQEYSLNKKFYKKVNFVVCINIQ